MSANLYDLIESRFPADRDRWLLEDEHGKHYRYTDLEQQVARIANLFAGCGLEPGDRVLVQTEKSPQVLALYLATLRAGLIYLPLNTAYKRDELDYFLLDAEPGAVVYSASTREPLASLAADRGVAHRFSLEADGSGSLMAAAAEQATAFTTVPREAGDVAAIVYTSGTTGRPKGAMISHGNLAANGLTLVDAWGFTDSDVLLHALPLFHVHGLFVACHCVLLSGARLLMLPRFESHAVIDRLPRATAMMGVPTYYTRLLAEAAFDAGRCSNMRLFVSGSAPLLESTFEAFRERTGHTILERYGMTETGMNLSNLLHGERRAGTVGFPLPGVEARIVDDQGRPVTDGSVGQLQVRGPNVFQGYWRKPDKTAEEFVGDGFFRTGDLASQDADGYFRIAGRGKDLIISGGLNVYPKEVESYIDALDGVLESAVIGLPHPDFGEAVAAVVVPQPGHENELSEAAIIATLKERVAGFKVPKRVFVTDALPRNTMGKVQKNVLRERYGNA